MMQPLVFTFVGADKPGLVEKIADTVSAQGGNWLESRMSELAGQFAGIVKVAVPSARAAALRSALLALSAHNLAVVVADSQGESEHAGLRQLHLTLVGNDRPGIVREVSHALAARNISVREMNTSITSAAMSGDPLFEAVAQIEVPQAQDLGDLKRQLHTIGDALSVHIDLEEEAR